jgi:two-component system, chemotaxis family, protein-glutamate methylesterase/glutaminase
MNPNSLRVLVVDDTAFYRKIVADALRAIADVEVVGTAVNGKAALEKLDELRPDLLTLDLEMPEFDGIEVLRRLRLHRDRPGVIMLSAHTSSGAAATTKALGLGAFDFVLKPVGSDPVVNARRLAEQLRHKVEAFAAFRAGKADQAMAVRELRRDDAPHAESGGLPANESVSFDAPSNDTPSNDALPNTPVEAVVLGISTGGPEALSKLLPRLPADLPVPILVVQHMPPIFTRSLADDLNARSALGVAEAVDGQAAEPGLVLIAPGGKQMRLAREDERLVVRITDDPPENSCRPAVDYLFRSAAEHLGPAVLALIMTGMGSDGTLGLRQLKRRGAFVIAQDRASSVVFGMPAGPIQEGLADVVAPLSEIHRHIIRCLAVRTVR